MTVKRLLLWFRLSPSDRVGSNVSLITSDVDLDSSTLGFETIHISIHIPTDLGMWLHDLIITTPRHLLTYDRTRTSLLYLIYPLLSVPTRFVPILTTWRRLDCRGSSPRLDHFFLSVPVQTFLPLDLILYIPPDIVLFGEYIYRIFRGSSPVTL